MHRSAWGQGFRWGWVLAVLLALTGLMGWGVASVGPVALAQGSTASETPVPAETGSPSVTVQATSPVLVPGMVPTATVTVTATPFVDVAAAMLSLKDLPSGFEAMSPEVVNLMTQTMPKTTGDSASAKPRLTLFMYPAKGTLAMHMLIYPLSPLERLGSGMMMNPETITPFLVDGLAGNGARVKDSATLPGMDKFGELSSGLTIAAVAANNVAMRIDTVWALRGAGFSLVAIFYPESSVPAAGVGDLAKLIDDRMALLLPAPAPAEGQTPDAPPLMPLATPTRVPPTVAPTRAPVPTRTPLPSPCGEMPPGMAGLLWINHFPEFATVTLTDHQYRVEGNSQLLMLIPAGKQFVIDANIVGVGQLKQGPFTWQEGECHVYNPGN